MPMNKSVRGEHEKADGMAAGVVLVAVSVLLMFMVGDNHASKSALSDTVIFIMASISAIFGIAGISALLWTFFPRIFQRKR